MQVREREPFSNLMQKIMKNIVLLGDSILDNAAYTGGGPDVAAQLHLLMSNADSVALLATDGDRTVDVGRQLKRVPAGATHLVLSVGGNDALMHSDFLMEEASSVAEVLLRARALADAFGVAHCEVLNTLLKTGLPFAVCTIYDCNFADPQMARLVGTALALFNEAIIRNAVECGVPVIDLRLVCSDADDYANEIEPSVQGGKKIARAIWRVVQEHNWPKQVTAIYA